MAGIFEIELEDCPNMCEDYDVNPAYYVMEDDHEYENIAEGIITAPPPSTSFM